MKPYIQYKLIIIPNSISCFHRALLTRVLRKLRLSHRHLLIKGIFYMISLKPPLKKNTRDGELFGMRKVIDGIYHQSFVADDVEDTPSDYLYALPLQTVSRDL